MEKKALKMFLENIGRKGLSYTDTVTIATIREYGIGYLLTYDTRSFANFVKNIVGTNYWNTLPETEKKRIHKLASKHLKEA